MSTYELLMLVDKLRTAVKNKQPFKLPAMSGEGFSQFLNVLKM